MLAYRAWDTGKMASDITVALITSGFTLGGAVVGASGALLGILVAPWVGWSVDKRRRRQDARAALISQWRVEIRQLRNAENNHLAHNEENKNNGLPEVPDPPESDPMQHEWFRRLRPELTIWAANRVNNLREKPVRDRKGQIPDVLEQQVFRIESKKWKLTESPL
jgi:hypothetical protein